jgi:hypothetical protein
MELKLELRRGLRHCWDARAVAASVKRVGLNGFADGKTDALRTNAAAAEFERMLPLDDTWLGVRCWVLLVTRSVG